MGLPAIVGAMEPQPLSAAALNGFARLTCAPR
jgi:hypothetical protein